tara:strand:- start:692 stop:1129 length:438 start_codon:yes stop_codon:yes gene_type:complete
MKIAFDIGGVLSKYPDEFRSLIRSLLNSTCEIYVITDMHDKAEVMQMLYENNFPVTDNHIYIADYKKYGEFCKAVILAELKIDIFIDDFQGYLQWDSQLGKPPIRLLVAPDGFAPYWHQDWITKDKSDFGRRVAPANLKRNSSDL